MTVPTRSIGLLLSLITLVPIKGQVVPYGSENSVPLAAFDTRSARVPAGASPTLIQLTVDPSAGGGDFFDILVGNSQVNISLILPSSAEVNAGNASAMGFEY